MAPSGRGPLKRTQPDTADDTEQQERYDSEGDESVYSDNNDQSIYEDEHGSKRLKINPLKGRRSQAIAGDNDNDFDFRTVGSGQNQDTPHTPTDTMFKTFNTPPGGIQHPPPLWLPERSSSSKTHTNTTRTAPPSTHTTVPSNMSGSTVRPSNARSLAVKPITSMHHPASGLFQSVTTPSPPESLEHTEPVLPLGKFVRDGESVKITNALLSGLKHAKTENEWKGGIRVLCALLNVYSRGWPTEQLTAVHNHIVSNHIRIEQKSSRDYVSNQFKTMYTHYKKMLMEYANRFMKETDAGREVARIIKEARKTKGHDAGDPIVHLPIVKCGKDLLKWNGLRGIEFEPYHAMSCMARPLMYLATEKRPREVYDDGIEREVTGWLASDQDRVLFTALYNSVLNDLFCLLEIESFLMPKGKHVAYKPNALHERWWNNRITIPDGRVPTTVDLSNLAAYFDDKRPTLKVASNLRYAITNINRYSTDALVEPTVDKHATSEDFGEGTDDNPHDRMDMAVSPAHSVVEMGTDDDDIKLEADDRLFMEETDIHGTVDYYTVDYAQIKDPSTIGLAQARSYRVEERSVDMMINDLNNDGTPHPFHGRLREEMTRTFVKVNTEPPETESAIARAFASGTVQVQARLALTNIKHRQRILSGIIKKCEGDIKSLSAYQAQVEAELKVVQEQEDDIDKYRGSRSRMREGIRSIEDKIKKQQASASRVVMPGDEGLEDDVNIGGGISPMYGQAFSNKFTTNTDANA